MLSLSPRRPDLTAPGKVLICLFLAPDLEWGRGVEEQGARLQSGGTGDGTRVQESTVHRVQESTVHRICIFSHQGPG